MSDLHPDDPAQRVKHAIFAGRKIQAIKLYRTQTGQGLAEAKDAVEKLETELRVSSPDQFTKAQAKGCMTVIIPMLILGRVIHSFFS